MPRHPALDSLERPSTIDLVKKGAEEVGGMASDAWDWATTPMQPAEGEGFVENTLAGMTSPAGIAEAIFPFVGMAGKGARWVGKGPTNRRALDKINMVAKGLPDRDQELLEQIDLVTGDQPSGATAFWEDPYPTIQSDETRKVYEALQKGTPLTPGTVEISNPRWMSHQELDEVLRHELRHGEQSYDQWKNVIEDKSLLSPDRLYGISRLRGYDPDDAYLLNPGEVDARSMEVPIGDQPNLAHSMESMGGKGQIAKDIWVKQMSGKLTDSEELEHLRSLSRDRDRTMRTVKPSQRYYLGNPRAGHEDAVKQHRSDVHHAVQSLINSLGLR